MSIHSVFPEQYQSLLDEKISLLTRQFANVNAPALEVFQSPTSHYRMRAEFKIWHEGDIAHYAMFKPGEYKSPFIIDHFPVGSTTIEALMPALLAGINASPLLKKRLFQVEFLTTLHGEAVITLIYHKPLSDEWESEARSLVTALNALSSSQQPLKVHLIGRSRKQKRVIGQDYVTETLTVAGMTYHYQQVETGFTQPNARVCEAMLAWAVAISQPLQGDLVELYCGNGNFTIPLAGQFRKVLATEISKTSVQSALYNLELNQIGNVDILRMSSEEFSQALDGVREFRRLAQAKINLADYDFSTIFVDPPRAGLDEHTTDIVKKFDNIIYISCNPETLYHNLDCICQTHRIIRFAAFDQFPYTPHLECGVLLQRKDS